MGTVVRVRVNGEMFADNTSLETVTVIIEVLLIINIRLRIIKVSMLFNCSSI